LAKGSPRSGKLAPAGQGRSGGAPTKVGVASASLVEPPSDEALALEAARYIAQMTAELASIARGSNLDLLAYFLDMARVEATSTVRKLEDGPD
jgi:hypothetical protein